MFENIFKKYTLDNFYLNIFILFILHGIPMIHRFSLSDSPCIDSVDPIKAQAVLRLFLNALVVL